MIKRKINYVLITILFLVLLSCASSPRFTSEKKNDSDEYHHLFTAKNEKLNNIKNSTIYKDAAVLETKIGTASYYADKFNGRITYSGEVYNMYGISAAHQTYPMGTILRVTNLKNNKTIILQVNDRMPYNPDRIIDLSLGAAKKLDMVNDGLAKVKIEVLKFGSGN